jgi:hypothetical protein
MLKFLKGLFVKKVEPEKLFEITLIKDKDNSGFEIFLIKNPKRLEREIILIAEDAGECCRDSMINLVQTNCNNEYSKEEIGHMINVMIARQQIIASDDYIFDPIAKPNTAKRVRNGGKVI